MDDGKRLKISIAIIAVLILLLLLLYFIIGKFQLDNDSDEYKTIELKQGQELALFEGDGDTITSWSSEDETIAVIDKEGKIMAKKPGTTTIIVETEDGEDKYEVVVNNPSEEADKNSDTEEKVDIPDNNSPVLYIENVKANAGDKDIVVKVDIKRNPGILGMILSVNYDDKNLALKDASCGDALDDALNFTKSNDLASGCRFVWDGVEISEDQIEDGTVLALTFEADSSIESGEYLIKISYGSGDIVDDKLIEVEPEIVNGNIIIE